MAPGRFRILVWFRRLFNRSFRHSLRLRRFRLRFSVQSRFRFRYKVSGHTRISLRFRLSAWFRRFSTVRSGIHSGLDGLGSDSRFNQDSFLGIEFQVRLEFSLRFRLSIVSNFQLGFSLPYPEKALPARCIWQAAVCFRLC